MLTRTEEITREVCADFEAELKQFNGEQDHVHPLVHYPPKVGHSHVPRYLWAGHLCPAPTSQDHATAHP